MRTALSMSLAGEPDIDVIGDAADGGQAVELAGRLRPDVVIMDIRMPGIDGITATRRLAGDSRHKVLVMTTFDLDEYIVDALRAGASGFILKDATSAELVHAVRVVAAGDALLSPQVTRRLLDRYAHRLPPTTADPYSAILVGITARERSVLRLVAQGLSNKAIGRQLHMAESSVKTHVSHLLAKLNRQDRVQLVILAYESGFIQPTGGLRPPG